MKNLRKNIIKNFDRFKNFFNDNIIYENNDQIFIEEIIDNFFNKRNFKFIINDNDLIITICNVTLIDDKNNEINKIGCIKTELDEILNNSDALKIIKCYLDCKEFEKL